MTSSQEKLKIAILGTRGIPNRYGGFEQCAEKIALYLVNTGHDVTVYNPPFNPYTKKDWNGIKLKKIFYNVWKFGFLDMFFFDYLSLKHALNQKFDIILELGYSPCSLFYYLKKSRQAKIVTNMDGLDWQRSKWNFIAKKILLFSEKLAVKKSDALISDNPGIRDYLKNKYGIDSHYIPYGAELVNPIDENKLKAYNLKKQAFFLMIARLEPENNIETILDGYLLSRSEDPLIIVGPETTKYSSLLRKKYHEFPNIKFLGGIYDFQKLNLFREHAGIYFHGHTVGGTNPSLLEAMAARAYIVAHDNIFNRHVLGTRGAYFSSRDDVARIICDQGHDNRAMYVDRNRKKIKQEYYWPIVADQYLKLFMKII